MMGVANQGRDRQEGEAIIPPEVAILTVLLLGSGLLALVIVIILNIINNPFWPFVWYALFGAILFAINLLIPEKHEKARVIREVHVESRRRRNRQFILPMIILYSTVISGVLIGAFLGPFLPLCVRGLIALGIFSIVLMALYEIINDDT